MFKSYVFLPAFLISIILGWSAVAAPLTVEEKTLDFQQLTGRIKSAYGPLVYKKDSLGIDIDLLQANYLRQIQESKTNQDFYYLINKFVAEFHDSHFAAMLPTDKRSVLPFFVEYIQGKVFIDEVIPELMPADKFPFQKGDELISMNGVLTEDLLKELMPFVGQGFIKTQKHFAAWMLTSRRSARVPTPEGAVTVVVRPVGKAETMSHSFNWKVQGEDPAEMGSGPALSYLSQISIANQVAGLVGDGKNIERRFMCQGDSRIAIPDHATVISKTPFVSYYYPTAKGNVGYVRIPHYHPTGEGQQAQDIYFSQYEKVIGIMEKNTVGLIIDQDFNCGGYVDLANRMVGLFMDKPYHPLYFKMVASKENYLEYSKYVAELNPLTSWYDNVITVMNLLKDYWQRGERMTSFTSLNGDTWLQPNLIHYTKPVVMLINEMSGSGGDGFPSMMQGYGRVKLLGTRTMGAGGHVVENPALNYSQITVSMTRSMFFRPDGVPVENNGAVPDYPYEITFNDFVGGYVEYRDFYTTKLLGLLP